MVGADHFYKTILAVRERTGATIEVLTPDFVMHQARAGTRHRSSTGSVQSQYGNGSTVVQTRPRPKERLSLDIELAQTRQRVKSANQDQKRLDVGAGETREELLDCLSDLLVHRLRFPNARSILAARPRYLPVVRYVPPAEFDELGGVAKQLGFTKVASGPSSARVITLKRWPTSSPDRSAFKRSAEGAIKTDASARENREYLQASAPSALHQLRTNSEPPRPLAPYPSATCNPA